MKKDEKKGGGVLLRISNSRSGTFQAWTERSPYTLDEPLPGPTVPRSTCDVVFSPWIGGRQPTADFSLEFVT